MNPIREAASNLRGHWYQGEYMNYEDNSQMCGLGHVANVLGKGDIEAGFETDEFYELQKFMDKVAKEQYPDRHSSFMAPNQQKIFTYSFPIFNDHPDTTEDEVVAVLEKAAVLYDEQV